MRKIILCYLVLASTTHVFAADQIALTQSLKTLVEIQSGTTNTSGVNKAQEWVKGQLTELGFKVEIDNNHLLIGTLKGVDNKVITFIGHTDTVFEANSPFRGFKIIENGSKAIGPGVIDDKGGLIVAIEGLRRFLASGQPKHTLRFIVSPAEETGSSALLPTFKLLGQDAWLVLGFEPSLEDGSIIESRRGNRWYEIKVTGKESHSGRALKQGANACVELAEKIIRISKLTDDKRDVSTSVGHIEGGQDKFNIVCGQARAKIDTRFASLADRDRLHQQIVNILNQTFIKETSTQFDIADDTPPFSSTKDAQPLIKKYLTAITEVEGKRPSSKKSLGTADVNNFSREGVIVIDGLGPVGGNMHTDREFIILSSLETRAEALNRFLKGLR